MFLKAKLFYNYSRSGPSILKMLIFYLFDNKFLWVRITYPIHLISLFSLISWNLCINHSYNNLYHVNSNLSGGFHDMVSVDMIRNNPVPRWILNLPTSGRNLVTLVSTMRKETDMELQSVLSTASTVRLPQRNPVS